MKKLVFPVLAALLSVFLLSGVSLNAADTVTDKLKNALIMYVGSPSAKAMNKTVQIDTSNMKVRPVNKLSLTYVPARFVVESLGGKSQWDGKTATATFILGSNTVKLTSLSDTMYVNGKKVRLSSPAEAEYGRMLVPLNEFAEAIGKQVFYDRGVIIISDTKELFNASTDKTYLNELAADIGKPPSVVSQAGLKNLLKQIRESNGNRYYNTRAMKSMDSASINESAVPEAKSTAVQDASTNGFDGASDFSTTNVQVQGVDEADVVKTDGEYIYQVNGNKIIIAKAYPASEMKLASEISFTDAGFSPQELYIDGNYLAVIGQSHPEIPLYDTGSAKIGAVYPPFQLNTVKTVIYDISNKKDVKLVREIELDGSYISSRKIGTRLYLLANKSINDIIYNNEWEQVYLKGDYSSMLSGGYSKEFIDNAVAMTEKPQYRDTAAGNGFIGLPYDKLRYFPDSIEPNYLTIASFDMAKPAEKADITSYLGAGSNIYASEKNMYISFTDYESYNIFRGKSIRMPENNYNTVVYRFSLESGKAQYNSKGTVPGSVLNQFSMDEDKGFFRIATTSGNTWGSGETASKNNVYILDDTMSITGKVENMAPGERIYSVRFAGDRAYVVTFRTVDPLFVLDLKDTKAPRILGSLKIPGYSDYLQPYDENHIIGFGKETVVIKGQAYYLGMKMAMFDVSDVAKPVRKFAVDIGDRGTDSELLRNHKALLFSKSKNLIAFPVNLYEVADKSTLPTGEESKLQYGSFTYQGAYVYQVDMTAGFKLKGRITHLSDEDYLKSGDKWHGSNKNIDRILYIDETLYTLSQSEIRASAISDLGKTGSLIIP